MLNDFNCSYPVYIACGYTDLRRGIDGLANLLKTRSQMDLFQRALFLFCGRRRDRLKVLYWEGDGFLLPYKRLERGSVLEVVPEGTPTEVVEHRLSEKERICNICGAVMEEIGKEVRRSLKMEPAWFWKATIQK